MKRGARGDKNRIKGDTGSGYMAGTQRRKPSDTGQGTRFLRRHHDIDKKRTLPALPDPGAPFSQGPILLQMEGRNQARGLPTTASGPSSLGFLVWPGLGERARQLRENSPARVTLGESEGLSDHTGSTWSVSAEQSRLHLEASPSSHGVPQLFVPLRTSE